MYKYAARTLKAIKYSKIEAQIMMPEKYLHNIIYINPATNAIKKAPIIIPYAIFKSLIQADIVLISIAELKLEV